MGLPRSPCILTLMPRSLPIHFRPLAEADLRLLGTWRAEPEVARWYGKALDLAKIEAKYRPRIEGREPVESFVIEVDARPVGHVQRYRLTAFPKYALRTGVSDRAVGMDLYVGEQDVRGRGLGTRVIEQFAAMCFENFPLAPLIVAGPDPSNLRSIRAFERAGFQYQRTIPAADGEGPEHVVVRTR